MNLGYNKTSKQVIFDGNSLTEKDGTGTDFKYRLPLTLYSTLRTNNKIFAGQHYGISGKDTASLITDFPTKISPFIRPNDIVVLWEITNDLYVNSATAQQAYDNLVTYSSLVRAKRAKIVIVGFIGRDLAGQPSDINTRGFACNALINSNNSFCDGWIDVGLNTAFNSQAAASNTTYYNADKIHLTDVGYDLVASLIEPTIRAII